MAEEQKLMVPLSMNELLNIQKSRPDALLCAGNTYLLTAPYARLEAQHRDLISLHGVEELRKIAKTDLAIDIGAMTSLDRILHADSSLLPPGMSRAIERTVPYPVRALATLGGNLSITHELLNLYPIMVSWDVKFELRKQGATRLIGSNEYLTFYGELCLDPGELLTRIRIPFSRWENLYYERIETENPDAVPTCSFIGCYRLGKGAIEEARMTFAISNLEYSFNSDIDAEMIGQHLPLSEKFIEDFSQKVIQNTRILIDRDNNYLSRRMRGMARHFLQYLNRV